MHLLGHRASFCLVSKQYVGQDSHSAHLASTPLVRIMNLLICNNIHQGGFQIRLLQQALHDLLLTGERYIFKQSPVAKCMVKLSTVNKLISNPHFSQK